MRPVPVRSIELPLPQVATRSSLPLQSCSFNMAGWLVRWLVGLGWVGLGWVGLGWLVKMRIESVFPTKGKLAWHIKD